MRVNVTAFAFLIKMVTLKRSLSGEKKYYLSDLGFFFASNTDNRINYGPTLENMLYIYACAHDCSVSIGKIGIKHVNILNFMQNGQEF